MMGTNLENLIFQLENSAKACMKANKNIWFFQALKENTTEGHCSWWIKFLDIVFHLSYTKVSFAQFIGTLRLYYTGNPSRLNVLKEFEQNYKSQDAVRWYTRDFLCLLMNRALRRRNIKLVFLMGFFLQDLYQQVAEEHEKHGMGSSKKPESKLIEDK